MLFKKISEITLNNKKVFIRCDMNTPIQDGVITDNTRILASIPTIKYAVDHGARVIVATHLGRPHDGVCDNNFSIKPIRDELAKCLGVDIPIITDIAQKIDFTQSKVVILENVRCNIGEKENNLELGEKYAALCDVFVYDAFATAHRKEASTNAIGLYTKEVCAGILMSEELEALAKISLNTTHPIVAIIGGSKVSTKLTILNNLSDKVDVLIVGGGILNTFLKANGVNIGKSLSEDNLVMDAKNILQKMISRGKQLLLPKTVVVADKVTIDANAQEVSVDDISENDMILDIGVDFALQIANILDSAGTIIWNGPLGVFEIDKFANGTKIVANAIASSNGFTLAGGGDTISAINKFHLSDRIDYISTGGGALLEFLEGKRLPAIELLEQKSI